VDVTEEVDVAIDAFPEETTGNRVSELSNLYPGSAQPSLFELVPKAVVPFSQQKYP
jgi:hypothetical protein